MEKKQAEQDKVEYKDASDVKNYELPDEQMDQVDGGASFDKFDLRNLYGKR